MCGISLVSLLICFQYSCFCWQVQGSSSVAVLLSLYVGYCYSQQAHDVYTTLHQRRCDDVVSTLCARWVLCRCVLSLFVLHLYFFLCLVKAVFHICGLSWIISFIFFNGIICHKTPANTQRRFYVTTSRRHRNDIVTTLYVYWDMPSYVADQKWHFENLLPEH